jgi:hypothetical protein
MYATAYDIPFKHIPEMAKGYNKPCKIRHVFILKNSVDEEAYKQPIYIPKSFALKVLKWIALEFRIPKINQ